MKNILAFLLIIWSIAVLVSFYIFIVKGIINLLNKIFHKQQNDYIRNIQSIINYTPARKPTITTNSNQIYDNSLLNKTELRITENNENYNRIYRPKIYLISLNELVFHNVLLEIAKELDLILCSQVSLYNIIEVRNDLNKSDETRYFNKIAKKSIDFVLVDKKDCRIRLCIELDDLTHKKYKRIERDKFINELFGSLGINLLRYPSRFHYNKEELKNIIKNNITKKYYASI